MFGGETWVERGVLHAVCRPNRSQTGEQQAPPPITPQLQLLTLQQLLRSSHLQPGCCHCPRSCPPHCRNHARPEAGSRHWRCERGRVCRRRQLHQRPSHCQPTRLLRGRQLRLRRRGRCCRWCHCGRSTGPARQLWGVGSMWGVRFRQGVR